MESPVPTAISRLPLVIQAPGMSSGMTIARQPGEYYSRGFPGCGRASAQRDVLAAWWCYIRSPPSGRRWLPGPGGDQPGVVVMPAGGGLVQPSPEGPAKREGKAGAGDQRGGVLPGEDGEPGGFGDGQLDGRDAGRAGLAAAAGNGRVAEGDLQGSVADVVVGRRVPA